MKSTIGLVALRFNPAFVQHIAAYAKALRELSFQIDFVLDPEYRKYPELSLLGHFATTVTNAIGNSYSHVFFFNISPQNPAVAGRFKSEGTKIFYLYHEPARPSLSWVASDGAMSIFKGLAADRLSKRLIDMSEKVILESEFGLNVYRITRTKSAEKGIYIPQLYEDEASPEQIANVGSKRYFSYIGNISRVHAFDRFVDVMRASFSDGANLCFLIASRTELPGYVLKDNVIAANQDKVEVHCGKPLLNEEINSCYAKSICIWNLYRRSTQSGVLPKAFMFGTPVVAWKTGSFPEYIEDRVNGRFVSPTDIAEILSIVDEIKGRMKQYSDNCRSSFLETFYYKSNLDVLSRLVN